MFLLNDLGSAIPRPFFGPKKHVEELRKNTSVRGPEMILKRGLQNRGFLGRPKKLVDMHWRWIAPKPLVLKRFADMDLCRSTVIERDSKDAKNRPDESLEKTVWPRSQIQKPFSSTTPKKEWHDWKFTESKPQFFAQENKGFQERRTGCQLTLPGPVDNS